MNTRILNTLTLLPTYRCTAACKNCCFGSNPLIRTRVPTERLLSYIDQAAAIPSMKVVVVSGGECFLLGKDLEKLIARASNHGLVTRVVTNGYWARSLERALHKLGRLRDRGLAEFNISSGDEHAGYVSVNTVTNAIVASLRLGLRTVLVVEVQLDSRLTKERFLAHPLLRQELQNPESRNRFVLINNLWMENFEGEVQQDDSFFVSSRNIESRKGCTSVLGTVAITPEEKLGMCCGLTREQIPELNAGSLLKHALLDLWQQAAQDFMKMWLFVEGPERILSWAAQHNPQIEWEGMYGHRCDACRALYQDSLVRETIREHYEEKYDDVLLRFSAISSYPMSLETTFGHIVGT